MICPPALDLKTAVGATIDTNVAIGAENMYTGKEGAFTGEISGRII
jgi:triosephosphate isomerase